MCCKFTGEHPYRFLFEVLEYPGLGYNIQVPLNKNIHTLPVLQNFLDASSDYDIGKTFVRRSYLSKNICQIKTLITFHLPEKCFLNKKKKRLSCSEA